MNRQNANEYLLNSREFFELPDQLREWILESPNATADFATFFEKSGKIRSEDIKLATYSSEQSPKIYVNEAQWNTIRQKDAPKSLQYHLFGTLAHEIGHDHFNTATVPFKGTTAEEYVLYRSELEANAIFNAFPIFKDLEQHPDFKLSFPFNDIGYLNGAELAHIYKEWDSNRLPRETAVSWMASKVADTPYTLGNPPQDMNRDGALTHRDAYLQDFELYVKPRLALQPTTRHSTGLDEPDYADRRVIPPAPSRPQQTSAQAREYHFFPRTPEDDYLDAYLAAVERNDHTARSQLTREYEQLPHVQAQQQQAREALEAERQKILEEQLRQEREQQWRLQQEQQRSHSLGFSR